MTNKENNIDLKHNPHYLASKFAHEMNKDDFYILFFPVEIRIQSFVM